MVNCSNLVEDYIGILNGCILSLHLCFAKDHTDRHAFIFINKQIIYICTHTYTYMHLFSQQVKPVLSTEKADSNDLLLAS